MVVAGVRLDCYSVTKGLVTIEEARERACALVDAHSAFDGVSVAVAAGRVLAQDVQAPIALPPFDSSAMDGYAVRVRDFLGESNSVSKISARIAAGDQAAHQIVSGTAFRIFTGARLPAGADAIVMQERCSVSGSDVLFSELPALGDNIRRRGEDVAKGETVLTKGLRLDARHVAILSALGIASIQVARPLRIAVISSGSELVEPGQQLATGQIFDSNSYMLRSLLNKSGVEVMDGGRCPDDVSSLAAKLAELSSKADMIIATGGVASGEEDHTCNAIRQAGGKAQSLQISLKPGKPSVIGLIGATAVLGLPGNPVAALVNFLLIGEAMISRLQGCNGAHHAGLPAISNGRYRHSLGRTEYVPAKIFKAGDDKLLLDILGRGGSARLAPLIAADGLAEIASDRGNVEIGTPLCFYPFGCLSWI